MFYRAGIRKHCSSERHQFSKRNLLEQIEILPTALFPGVLLFFFFLLCRTFTIDAIKLN